MMQQYYEKTSPVWRSIRLLKTRLVEPVLRRFNWDLVRTTPEWQSYIKDVDIKRMVALKTGKVLAPYLEESGFSVDRYKITRWFEEFSTLVYKYPIKNTSSNDGFNAGFELFALSRALRPSVFIQSGISNEFTTWVVKKALPETVIYSFGERGCRGVRNNTKHFSHDWNSFDFSNLLTKNSLVYFDDHVSQAERVIESRDRGFSHVIFNNNRPVHVIHSGGWPASPTLDMVLDKSLKHGQGIHWESPINRFSYNHDLELSIKVRSAIETIVRLPNLSSETGYKPANLTYLRVVQS
jgi:hypothetical protein